MKTRLKLDQFGQSKCLSSAGGGSLVHLRRKRSKPDQIWEVKIFLSTNDENVVDDLVDQFGDLVCPPERHDTSGSCETPWFITSRRIEKSEVKKWSELLNR